MNNEDRLSERRINLIFLLFIEGDKMVLSPLRSEKSIKKIV